MLFADLLAVLPLVVLVTLAVIGSALQLIGALLAVLRHDHRNPMARWFTDWFEHRHPL